MPTEIKKVDNSDMPTEIKKVDKCLMLLTLWRLGDLNLCIAWEYIIHVLQVVFYIVNVLQVVFNVVNVLQDMLIFLLYCRMFFILFM